MKEFIDNACGASPATPSAQSSKNLDFEDGDAFLMPPGGLWRAWGAAPEASWGPLGRILGPKASQKTTQRTQTGRKRPPRGPQETPKSPKEAAKRVPGDPPTVRKGPQETSQRASEAKIRQTSKMTTFSTENLDLGGPKGQKLKENLKKIVFTTAESSI